MSRYVLRASSFETACFRKLLPGDEGPGSFTGGYLPRAMTDWECGVLRARIIKNTRFAGPRGDAKRVRGVWLMKNFAQKRGVGEVPDARCKNPAGLACTFLLVETQNTIWVKRHTGNQPGIPARQWFFVFIFCFFFFFLNVSFALIPG